MEGLCPPSLPLTSSFLQPQSRHPVQAFIISLESGQQPPTCLLALFSLAPQSIPFVASGRISLKSSPVLLLPNFGMGCFLGSQNTCF